MKERDDNVLCLMQVTGKHGAKLREGIDLHSAEIACTSDNGSILPKGTVVHVISEATTSDGTAERVQISHPACGWISKRFLSPVEGSSAAPALAEAVAPPAPPAPCLLYTSPSPRDRTRSRMPSSA